MRADIIVHLQMRDGETFEEAKERLFRLLYDGLCNTADHVCDFEIVDTED